MKRTQTVIDNLSNASYDIKQAVQERDDRIVQLERELREARKPRNRVTLIGGPNDGDVQLFDVHSQPYIITLRPRYNRMASAWDPGDMRIADMTTEQSYYRIVRMHTGEGDRFVGVFERSV